MVAPKDGRPFEISIDHENECVRIQGVDYAFGLFDGLATFGIGTRFEIIKRDDHVVSVKVLREK